MKEALARGLLYFFLTCGSLLNIVVMSPHNHQLVQCMSNHLTRCFDFELGSIRIRQTGLCVDATCLVLHLVYTFKCSSIYIVFASVDRPSHIICIITVVV